jgi:hypothetical protein
LAHGSLLLGLDKRVLEEEEASRFSTAGRRKEGGRE